MQYIVKCPNCGLNIEFLIGQSDDVKKSVLFNEDNTIKKMEFQCRCNYVTTLDENIVTIIE